MKKIFGSILLLAFCNFSFAQAPEGINYQSVLRNLDGTILSNSSVAMQLSILQGSSTGTTVYSESHSVSTNDYGLINVVLGDGAIESGDFSTIDWANGPYFLEIAVDENGGTNYTALGTQQLISVPYALYAKTAGNGPQGPQGDQGLSAYEVWLSLGNTGTETDFINSLTGPAGADGADGATGPPGTPGNDGANGLDGANGQSAYELWLAQGNTGTEADFLNSLVGPQGTPGVDGTNGMDGINGTNGADGTNGIDGVNGTNGIDGTNGTDGQSAYEIWLAQGNIGTEADFLNSLVGPQGAPGTNGTDGVNGINGVDGANGNDGINGADGASAYEVWLSLGNTGTETDFMNSLTGPQGPAGLNGADGINGVDGLLPNGTAIGNTTFWNGTEWVVNDQNLFHDGTNVGISINTPSNKLDVNGDATFRGGTIHLWPQDAASQEGAQINLSKHGSAANGPTGAWGIDVYQNDFRILNNDVASPGSEYVRINETSGNMGIGVISPQAKLDVSGDIAFPSQFKLKPKGSTDNENYLMYEPTVDGLKVNGYDAVFITTGNPANATFGQDLVVRGGRVGINTNTPSTGLLHVNGYYDHDLGGGFAYYARNTPGDGNPNTGQASGNQEISIFATHRVVAGEFNAFSDKRIKDVKGLSNKDEDLATLQKIKITNYTLKDKLSDQRPIKKVIAQELEKIFPQAVSQTTNVVPDVYQMAKMKDGIITLENNLEKGERVRLVFSDKDEVFEVLKADKNSFSVALSGEQEVFVYGREVDDFRMVDYEALTTLNISATQALLKRIENLENQLRDITVQKSENKELKSRLENLEKAVNSLMQISADATQK